MGFWQKFLNKKFERFRKDQEELFEAAITSHQKSYESSLRALRSAFETEKKNLEIDLTNSYKRERESLENRLSLRVQDLTRQIELRDKEIDNLRKDYRSRLMKIQQRFSLRDKKRLNSLNKIRRQAVDYRDSAQDIKIQWEQTLNFLKIRINKLLSMATSREGYYKDIIHRISVLDADKKFFLALSDSLLKHETEVSKRTFFDIEVIDYKDIEIPEEEYLLSRISDEESGDSEA